MSETVTIALLGNPKHAFDNDAFTWREDDEGGALEFDIPWDDLPKVTIEAEPSETIRQVLGRALQESGIELDERIDREDHRCPGSSSTPMTPNRRFSAFGTPSHW